MQASREYWTIKKVLEKEGLKLAENCTIWSIIDYLDMVNDYEPSYTVFDWIKDTKENYPETFVQN